MREANWEEIKLLQFDIKMFGRPLLFNIKKIHFHELSFRMELVMHGI